MKIDIRHIAKLSRLQIDEEKFEQLEQQMQVITDMVENMPDIQDDDFQLDTEKAMQLRSDTVIPSMKRDELFANAPVRQAGCVVVPKTV